MAGFTNLQDNLGGGGEIVKNEILIDQSGGGDTYGTLSGSVDGVNTTFTVSNGSYSTGKIIVYLNGQLQTQGALKDWTETMPASGTFDFNTAPVSGDEIIVFYIK